MKRLWLLLGLIACSGTTAPATKSPTELQVSRVAYNSTAGRYELWYRFYVNEANGTQHEMQDLQVGPEQGGWARFTLTVDIRERGSGAVASELTVLPDSLGEGTYDRTVPGWKISWKSSAAQSWNFHMQHQFVGDTAKATLDRTVP